VSFDLAVWHEPGPITVAEAQVTYQAICAGSSKLRTHPSVRAFRVEIAKWYPPETEERSLSASPWTAPLVVSRSFVLMSCSPQWRGFLLLIEEIRDLAGRLGLLCYDPQERALLRPAAQDESPALQLTTALGPVFDEPHPEAVRRMLRKVSHDAWHATLTRRDGSYLRVGYGFQAGTRPGWYVLQHQETNAGQQYRTVITDLREVLAAFEGFGTGDATWINRFAWQSHEP
jgi:hypothetical protein